MAKEDDLEVTGQSADDRPEGNAPVPERPSPETEKAQAKPDRDGYIPRQALDAEKARRRKAEQDASRAAQEAAQYRGYLSALQEQAKNQPAQQQPQQQQPLPNWYDDPDNAFKARIDTTITPEVRALRQQFEEFQKNSAQTERQRLVEHGRITAEEVHGADTVKAAYEALDTAMRADPRLDAEMKARLAASSNPYGEIVRWHKTQTEKPNEIEAEVERRLAERMAQMNGASPMQPYAPQSPYPSNFANSRNASGKQSTSWGGPKPLTEIFGGR